MSNGGKKKNPLNEEFTREFGISPGQRDNPPKTFHTAQLKVLKERKRNLEKQIQSIHQKLGGKEGHTITYLSLENHGLKQECYRLNGVVVRLEEELNRYKDAYNNAHQRIAQDDLDKQFLETQLLKYKEGEVLKAAGAEVKRLKDKLKEAEEKIEGLKLRESIHKLTLQRQARQEYHKISLKF